MSLRIQLLGLGLLTLALPWAGYRYVQELEGALRSGLEQSLLGSANTMAAAFAAQDLDALSGEAHSQPPESTLYAPPLAAQPRLDGYRTDWASTTTRPMSLGEAGLYWAGVYERALFVFIEVTDEALVYQSGPTRTPYGDRLLIRPGGEGAGWLLLHTTGPGALRSQLTVSPQFAPSGHYEGRVRGFWRETSGGYVVEARIPLDLLDGRLGLGLVDVDPGADTQQRYRVTMHTSSGGTLRQPGRFVYRPPDLAEAATRFQQAGRRLRVLDATGWVLFDGGAIDPSIQPSPDGSLGLSERFFRFILSRDDPPYQDLEEPPGHLADLTLRSALGGASVAAWYRRGGEESAIVAAAVPVVRRGAALGAVVVEQGSDAILTLTNAALVRLMSATLLASFVAAGGLLSYATLLSIRVRRLARAADTALSPEGEIHTTLPGAAAADEIGDLARSFSALLKRLNEYTEYLRTLKGKLAHELRTPLAVVSTSLDNLDRESDEARISPYLTRLREGTERLDSILNAMSEATAIEQAIAETEAEFFRLDAVLESCVDAYQDIYPRRRLRYSAQAAETGVLGSPDLIAQMMDKLIDNAVSFSPIDSTIDVELRGDDRELSVAVINRGRKLPGAMRAQLFDSLVSIREGTDQRHHLGLGLYIVSLIASFHRGRVQADDLPDGSGVVFEVILPVAVEPTRA
jgi:dedicated sortase system histidine kinase